MFILFKKLIFKVLYVCNSKQEINNLKGKRSFTALIDALTFDGECAKSR